MLRQKKKSCLLVLVRPTVLSGPTIKGFFFLFYFFCIYLFIKILNFSPEKCWTNGKVSSTFVSPIPPPAGLPNSISRPCDLCKNLYNIVQWSKKYIKNDQAGARYYYICTTFILIFYFNILDMISLKGCKKKRELYGIDSDTIHGWVKCTEYLVYSLCVCHRWEAFIFNCAAVQSHI